MKKTPSKKKAAKKKTAAKVGRPALSAPKRAKAKTVRKPKSV